MFFLTRLQNIVSLPLSLPLLLFVSPQVPISSSRAELAPGGRERDDAHCGGDSSEVRYQLKGVQQIQAAALGAFAAILADGSVVTWGAAGFGGDSLAVRDQLKWVCSRFKLLLWQQIQATNSAFAAILAGSVVSWGDAHCGGQRKFRFV